MIQLVKPEILSHFEIGRTTEPHLITLVGKCICSTEISFCLFSETFPRHSYYYWDKENFLWNSFSAHTCASWGPNYIILENPELHLPQTFNITPYTSGRNVNFWRKLCKKDSCLWLTLLSRIKVEEKKNKYFITLYRCLKTMTGVSN